ncbi:MAG: hypothetical protein Q4B07_00080 [Clostridia bacterium]|nr:hypothetical protein [Clostridia bacterium]
MRKSRLIIGIVLILIAAIALVFIVRSVHDSLPKEGKWKGNIHQFKPTYNGEGLVIILVGIAGAMSFLGGIYLTIVALREDIWW